MSSTNRSDARDFHKSDYYITPQKHVDTFLDTFLPRQTPHLVGGCLALDPCAGGDKQNDMPYPRGLFEYGIMAMTNDIREDSPATMHTDFLQHTTAYTDNKNFTDYTESNELYDLIITNPPFAIALPIIEKALELTKEGGYVVMLLRLNFFGSKGRKKFFEANMPTHCYIHHERMSFTEDGATDSIEYAHFVWTKGVNPDYTKTYLI